jgi:Cu/Zn superoxide dismutase
MRRFLLGGLENAMLKADLSSIKVLMERSAAKMVGETTLATKNQDDATAYIRQIFGFLPQDVEGIHTHKAGEGHGMWFRLKDGRVFTKYGKPAKADHALYDKV